MSDAEHRKNIRRTTLLMSAIAFAFFVGFIMMGFVRA